MSERMNTLLVLVAAVVVTSGLMLPVQAVVVGQLDDFQDLTTMGWGTGNSNPTPPENIANGGPNGAGDAFLLITSDTNNQGGKNVVANNGDQWAGDLLISGLTGISMQLNNLSDTVLTMRLAMNGGGGQISLIDGFTLDANSGWVTVEFSLDPADYVVVSQSGNVLDTMTNVSTLRLVHLNSPGFSGDNVTAMVGVDNIRAIPEPTGFVILLGSACVMIRRKKRAV